MFKCLKLGLKPRLHDMYSSCLCFCVLHRHSVMKSDGHSYYGDVVLDSFNMIHRDEDSILDQKHEKQIFWNLYYKDFKIQYD